jgi:hypothetical protein
MDCNNASDTKNDDMNIQENNNQPINKLNAELYTALIKKFCQENEEDIDIILE